MRVSTELKGQALYVCAHHEATSCVRCITPPCPWSSHNYNNFLLFLSCCLCLSISSLIMSFNFSLVLTCFHFCEEDRISTGMNLWIHGEGKRSRKRSLLWEVGREDSVSLVFVMLLMSDILTENSFKALLYRFQTPPPLLYVTEWVFMWSLLLATLGLHSDLHKYMADGEDRPLSLSLFIRLSASVCVSHARVGLAVPVWRVWGDCSYSQSVCFCQTHCPSPSLQVEWKVCVRVCMRGSFFRDCGCTIYERIECYSVNM